MENNKSIILDYLSSSFLFRGLPALSLQELAQKSSFQIFTSRDTLIEEGIRNDKIMIIAEGIVKIYKITPEGKEIFLAIEKSGDIVGVLDMKEKAASATIEALQKTKVVSFPKKDLLSVLQQNPILWEKMYKIVLAKLDEYRELQSITLGNNLHERTYLLLQILANLFPNKIIPLSQEIIASIVGATRPRVTEVLHILQKSKKIHIAPKKITVL